jgi:predicted nucleotidyltransferase
VIEGGQSEIIDDKEQIIHQMEQQFEQQSEVFANIKYVYDSQVQKIYEKCSVGRDSLFIFKTRA